MLWNKLESTKNSSEFVEKVAVSNASGLFTLIYPLDVGGWELQKQRIYGTGKKSKKSRRQLERTREWCCLKIM